jgi:glycerol-3-phosphate dehydrogenase
VAPLAPDAREAALATLSTADLDVLVVGGGITGAGVARDAALRGLRVALLEANDFAAGTSSRSSKLIHGGVRYLQQGDVALVREAANERQVLRALAPHLAEPLRMVLPTHGLGAQTKMRAGLWAFERLTSVPPGEHYAMWGREEALRAEPLLAPERLYGAAMFVEYLTDDARLVLANVASAAEHGALVANHAEVTALDGGEATVRDTLGGRTLRCRARMVVNAAGPWVEEVWRRAHVAGGRRLQLTKGIHLVVDHARLPLRNAVVMSARDKRSVFAIPRDGISYVGTTDTFVADPAYEPGVTRDDVDYLLEAANRTFRGAPLAASDVLGSWSGLRPLLAEEGKAPSEISRKDELMVDPAHKLVSVAGGKLTTYRKMAERVVDAVVQALGASAGPCRTAEVPRPGGERPAPTPDAVARRLPALGLAGATRLVRLHGAYADDIAARTEADAAAGALVDGLAGVLRAEVEHVLDAEMALALSDVMERRLRLLTFDPHQGLAGVEAVARIAAARLGWDDARTAAEVDAYRTLAHGLRSFA